MKNGVRLIEIDRLKIHEAICSKRVGVLVEQIVKDGFLRNPVVVDCKTLVLLDGHHRLAALRKLGLKKIPAFLIDYQSDQVRVYLRKKELITDLVKEAVIQKALSGKAFPHKTTRHFLKHRPRNVNVRLESLT